MDRELIERAQRGDTQAFGALAAESIDQLYSTAVLIVRDRSVAEDATQEALVRAWRGLPRLRDPDRFAGWLHRILVRACLDSAGRARQSGVPLLEISVDQAGSFESAVDDRDQVNRALGRLRPGERTILVLRFLAGLSVPELADALAVPVGTAKSRLHHALNAFRAAIDADLRVELQGGPA